MRLVMQLSGQGRAARLDRGIASTEMVCRRACLIAWPWCCTVLSACLQEDALPAWFEKQEDKQRAQEPTGKKKQQQKAEL